MIKELIQAFMMVFVAEMGDKTQIIAMTFATQYLISEVLAGVTLGVIFNHGIAIILGRYLSSVVPMNVIQIVAGFVFIIFGLLTLNEEDDGEFENKKELSPIITVGLAFFVGELGDKTQLTAMTLATEAVYPLFILIGTTLAMLATSSLGIFVGSKLGDKIPETYIGVGSSVIFIFFGIVKLRTTIPMYYQTTLNWVLFILVLGLLEIVMVKKYLESKRMQGGSTPLKLAAEKLYLQTELLEMTLDSICLGEDVCGNCMLDKCLVGYVRNEIKEARGSNQYYNANKIDIEKLVKKEWNRNNVINALALVVRDYTDYGWDASDGFIVNDIRLALEQILFDTNVESIKNIDNYLSEIKLLDEDIYIKIVSYLKSSKEDGYKM